MPVRERPLQRTDVPSEQELRQALLAELDHPQESGEPDIIIERPAPGTIHLYVIWSHWGDLEQAVRSRIILDAFEEAKGATEAEQVTVSMGLTANEAERLGVH